MAREVEFLTPRGADGGEPEGADVAAGFVKVDEEERKRQTPFFTLHSSGALTGIS